VGAPALSFATAIGAGAVVGVSNTVVLGRGADTVQIPGTLAVGVLAGGGTAALCRNPANQVASCSSSLRYKSDVAPFQAGRDVVGRLRPIRFTWKTNGSPDIGLAAEDVADVEPLLAFRNGQGEIEGVNYSQLNVVLINAIQQQQTRSEEQEARLRRQQQEIDALKALVCDLSPQAGLCLDARASR
jgi:hypothetical protein